MNNNVYEKVADYKRDMKYFVKGLVKSKLFQNEDGDLVVTITKNYDKAENARTATLTVESPCGCFKAEFTADVCTRIYNKVDPTLFEQLGDQLSRTKNFGKLVVK